MKLNSSPQKLLFQLNRNHVYRREDLLVYSKSLDRNLKYLVNNDYLKKVGPGLYLYPKVSTWGPLPAELKSLVKSFLKSDNFLLLSNNDYNNLGLGLTQLWNEVRVFNKKRHVKLKLGNFNLDFQIPFNGYPKKLTKEFLLIDLFNSLADVGEDLEELKRKIVNVLEIYDSAQLFKLSKQYGKVATKKYFEKILSR